MRHRQEQRNHQRGEQLQVVGVQAEPQDHLDDHVVDDGAQGDSQQLQRKIAEQFAEYHLADDHGRQADDDGAAPHLHIRKALVLGHERAGKRHQAVADHQADDLLRTGEVVNNDYFKLTTYFETAWRKFHRKGAPELYPEALRGEIDELNDYIFHNVNNGVYKAGFAQSQSAYSDAFNLVFDALDALEERLAGRRFLFGEGVGGWLRALSLDEFPQFFNVLKGDMSLVGTRPPTVDEWHRYEPYHRSRMSTRPGITGLWQVSGRSNIRDFDTVVRMDREYIENWSLKQDIHILFKTVWVVLKRKGAM